MKNSKSIFSRAIDPPYQAAMALGSGLVISVAAKLIGLMGITDVGDRFPWMSAAAFLLVFALFNSIFSINSKNTLTYWKRSIYSFFGLAITSGSLAYLLSSLTINEAGSYRWIFIVVSIGYLIFLSLMGVLRNIVTFAQREEWNSPRTRRK